MTISVAQSRSNDTQENIIQVNDQEYDQDDNDYDNEYNVFSSILTT
jgi:hypothetical protein